MFQREPLWNWDIRNWKLVNSYVASQQQSWVLPPQTGSCIWRTKYTASHKVELHDYTMEKNHKGLGVTQNWQDFWLHHCPATYITDVCLISDTVYSSVTRRCQESYFPRTIRRFKRDGANKACLFAHYMMDSGDCRRQAVIILCK